MVEHSYFDKHDTCEKIFPMVPCCILDLWPIHSQHCLFAWLHWHHESLKLLVSNLQVPVVLICNHEGSDEVKVGGGGGSSNLVIVCNSVPHTFKVQYLKIRLRDSNKSFKIKVHLRVTRISLTLVRSKCRALRSLPSIYMCTLLPRWVAVFHKNLLLNKATKGWSVRDRMFA